MITTLHCAQLFSHVQLFLTPWIVACQGPLPMEISPGKNIGVGCHALLQGIFPTQWLNPGLPHYRWFLYRLSHQGNPITTLGKTKRFVHRKSGANYYLSIIFLIIQQEPYRMKSPSQIGHSSSCPSPEVALNKINFQEQIEILKVSPEISVSIPSLLHTEWKDKF